MKFSICAEMIFLTVPFAERLDRIREAGFETFEFWAWKDKDLPAIEARIQAGMRVGTFRVRVFRWDFMGSPFSPPPRRAAPEALPPGLDVGSTGSAWTARTSPPRR